VSHADLPVRLSQGPIELLLVQVGASADATLSVIRQAQTLTRAPVMILGGAAQSEDAGQYVQAGAFEFLDETQLRPGLEGVLEKLRLSGDKKFGQGTMIGVLSATPGSGVTTIAANLAFALAEKHPNKVALLELGRGVADMALSLDLQPRHTIADVHQNWQRLDATLLRQSMLAHPAGVQILAHKPETLTMEPLAAQAVRKSAILMRTTFELTVLDLGHTVGEEQVEALRVCDYVVVVVRLDVPALRQARRFLRLLDERGVPRDRIRLVANRYGQPGQIAWKKAEEALGEKFAQWITDDSGKLNSALNQGLPLVKVARYAGITRRFSKLADMLNGKK
jgi:pilus assembly protein CpaE